MTNAFAPPSDLPREIREILEERRKRGWDSADDPEIASELHPQLARARSGSDVTRARCAIAFESARTPVLEALRFVRMTTYLDELSEGAFADLKTWKSARRVARAMDDRVTGAMQPAWDSKDMLRFMRLTQVSFALKGADAAISKDAFHAAVGAAEAMFAVSCALAPDEVVLREAERGLAYGRAAIQSGAVRRAEEGQIELGGSVGRMVFDRTDSEEEAQGHVCSALIAVLMRYCDA